MNNLLQILKKFPVKDSDDVIKVNIIKAMKEYFEKTAENPSIYAKYKSEYDAFLDKHVTVEVNRNDGTVSAYISKEVLDLNGDEPWDFTVIDINQAKKINPIIECSTDDEPVFCNEEFDLSLIEDIFENVVHQYSEASINKKITELKNNHQNSSIKFTTSNIDEEIPKSNNNDENTSRTNGRKTRGKRNGYQLDDVSQTDSKIFDELFESIENLKSLVDIDDDTLIEKLTDAIYKTVKKYYEHDVNNKTVYFKTKESYEEYMKEHIKIHINIAEKTFSVFLEKEVVDINGETPWDFTIIDVRRANQINEMRCKQRGTIPQRIVCGTEENPVYFPVKLNVSKLGRTAIAQAKQSLRGDIKEILKTRLIEKFQHLERCCITTTVLRIEPVQYKKGDETLSGENIVLAYNGSEVTLYPNEQIPGEKFTIGQTLKVYVLDINNKNKDGENPKENKKSKSAPYVKLSRVHWDFIRKLLEEQVPEIRNGIVEIKEIAREAGKRTKIAVISHDSNIDPVSACIGVKNSRLIAVRKELGYNPEEPATEKTTEHIDIVNYSPDITKFVANALSPAKVLSVTMGTEIVKDKTTGETIIDEKTGKPKENPICRVIVPNNQFSLAIGDGGQNAKLAAKLTKHKIDIKTEKPMNTTNNPKPKKDNKS